MAEATAPVGIDGLLALAKGLEDLALDYKTVMADGKVDMKDLSVLSALFLQFSELKAAVDGAKTVPAEVKDLDESEAKELAAALFKIYAALKA